MKAISKASDIPDEMILKYLAQHQGRWTMLFRTEFSTWLNNHPQSLYRRTVVPDGTPEKVLRAKMRSLYKRGLVGGCPCGCRGDFEITDKGLELIGQPRTAPYSGY
jgi:hypothetical protein